jgi:tetratricopeptide (TPR) repeat protein
MFKHPLTQEVVYNGLLKKERQEIHEQIGLVMEKLFQERLPEFHETLAYHFKQGRSSYRAIDYLMKSGEKSLKRYAVEESHQYYKEAYELLSGKSEKSRLERELLIDLLIKWALVFYYRGNFRELTELLTAHEELAESLDDKARQGMFLAWLGFAWYCRGKSGDAYQFLSSALKIAEEINDQKLIGYCCAWLVWTCIDVGFLKQAIAFGERGREISKVFECDQYLYFKSLAGLGRAYATMGEYKKVSEAGKALLEYGRRHSNIRSLAMGHVYLGYGSWGNGESTKAIEFCREALQVSQDPFYSQLSRLYYGIWNFMSGHLEDAEEALTVVLEFSQAFGAELLGEGAQVFLGAILLAKGQMSQGLKMLEEVRVTSLENKNRVVYVWTEYILGKVYSQIVRGGREPIAGKKAEGHFNETISVAKEAEMKGFLGLAYLDLGLLHKANGKTDEARECISKALEVFEQCDAEYSRKQASEALASLR